MSTMTILPDLTGQTIESITLDKFGGHIVEIRLQSGYILTISTQDNKLCLDYLGESHRLEQ
jgi:hypothetical protein